MNRTLLFLLVALLLQCALAVALYWPRPEAGQLDQADALLPFDPALVRELQIGDQFDNETVMKKSGDHWVLPEMEGLPADGEKIGQLLASLANSDQDWPVANTPAASQRFQVASYHYQRRLTFIGEEELLGSVFLGTSPGFRKVHARNETQDQIFSIQLSSFDAPATASAWLDRKLLQIRAPVRIAADGYSLSREGGSWVNGTGQVPDQRELEALLSILRSLQVEGLAGEDQQRDLAAAEAELVLQITSLSGETTLELFTLAGQHYIHSSEYRLFFTLSGYQYDRLSGIDAIVLEGDAAHGIPTGAQASP